MFSAIEEKLLRDLSAINEQIAHNQANLGLEALAQAYNLAHYTIHQINWIRFNNYMNQQANGLELSPEAINREYDYLTSLVDECQKMFHAQTRTLQEIYKAPIELMRSGVKILIIDLLLSYKSGAIDHLTFTHYNQTLQHLRRISFDDSVVYDIDFEQLAQIAIELNHFDLIRLAVSFGMIIKDNPVFDEFLAEDHNSQQVETIDNTAMLVHEHPITSEEPVKIDTLSEKTETSPQALSIHIVNPLSTKEDTESNIKDLIKAINDLESSKFNELINDKLWKKAMSQLVILFKSHTTSSKKHAKLKTFFNNIKLSISQLNELTASVEKVLTPDSKKMISNKIMSYSKEQIINAEDATYLIKLLLQCTIDKDLSTALGHKEPITYLELLIQNLITENKTVDKNKIYSLLHTYLYSYMHSLINQDEEKLQNNKSYKALHLIYCEFFEKIIQEYKKDKKDEKDLSRMCSIIYLSSTFILKVIETNPEHNPLHKLPETPSFKNAMQLGFLTDDCSWHILYNSVTQSDPAAKLTDVQMTQLNSFSERVRRYDINPNTYLNQNEQGIPKNIINEALQTQHTDFILKIIEKFAITITPEMLYEQISSKNPQSIKILEAMVKKYNNLNNHGRSYGLRAIYTIQNQHTGNLLTQALFIERDLNKSRILIQNGYKLTQVLTTEQFMISIDQSTELYNFKGYHIPQALIALDIDITEKIYLLDGILKVQEEVDSSLIPKLFQHFKINEDNNPGINFFEMIFVAQMKQKSLSNSGYSHEEYYNKLGELAKVLLKYDKDFNSLKDKDTPYISKPCLLLHTAFRFKNMPVAKAIIEFLADKNPKMLVQVLMKKDYKQQTVEMIAKTQGLEWEEIISAEILAKIDLVKKGAKPRG